MKPKDAFERWDAELSATEQELVQLLQHLGHGPRTARRNLLTRKSEALHASTRLERALRTLESLAAKDLLLLPREKALLHWCKAYAQRVRAYATQRADVMVKNLWLRLVRARLATGDERIDGLTDGDDLVGLSTRRARLGKTEKYLDAQLQHVRKEQRRLLQVYEALGVEGENRSAALSLAARLGEDWGDAQRNPTLRGLAEYLGKLAASVHRSTATQRLNLAQNHYAQKSVATMQFCRDLVLGKARGEADAELRLRRAMRQMDELQQVTDTALDAAAEIPVSDARPIVRATPRTQRAAGNSANSSPKP